MSFAKTSRRPTKNLSLGVLAMVVVAAVLVSFSFAPARAQGANFVGTTTNQYGLGYSTDGYTCGANGLFWVFYNDGTDWGYRSSTNGLTWSAETTLTSSVPPPPGGTNDMAFTCSGNTVYYVGGKESIGENKFYYNSGTLNADGAIGWSGETSVTTNGYADGYPSIAVDSNQDVWVAIQTQPGSGGTSIEVWEYVSGWTLSDTLSFSSPSSPIPQLIPLAGGEMALTYGQPDGAGSSITVATFSGSSWSPGPSTSATDYKFLYSDSVAIGSTVETCAADGTNVYYLSYTYGGASWTSPVTIAPGAACSLSSDGSSTLGIFYVSSPTTIEYSQSDNSGGSFAGSVDIASGQSGVISIGAAFEVSSDPAKQAMAVWVSGSSSIEFSNVSTSPVVNEKVTITGANSGPVATATVSGCHATVASIPMDGSPHTFGADPSCALTITVPADTLYTRYRFPGTSTNWTFETGSSGTDVESNSVYYQFAVTASYTVSGGGSAPAPSLTSTQTGATLVSPLSGAPTIYWLDSGAAWSVPATLTSGVNTWSTAPSSGTVTGPTILTLVYSPPVTTTVTSISVSTTTSTPSTTVTSTATTTVTSTDTTTTTVTSTATTTTTLSTGPYAVPSASSLTCNQAQPQVNHRVECTDLVYTADNGTALGSVTWATNGGGAFSDEQCESQGGGNGGFQAFDGQKYVGGAQLQCQAQYTPTASGVQTLTATYADDPYHSSSSGTAVIFVGNTSGSRATATSLTCDQVYLEVGEDTYCQAVVTAADGGALTGTVAWSSTDDGTFSRATCEPYPRGGQLQCSAEYSPGSSGAQTATATYSGDAGHLSSSGSFEVFVSNAGDTARQTAVVLAGGSVAAVGLSVAVMEVKKGKHLRAGAPSG